MTDLIDRANSNAQAWLDEQIAKNHHAATDDTECIDCGVPIGQNANKLCLGQYAVINVKPPKSKRDKGR